MTEPTSRTGSTLGPYRIEKLMGRGGMGEVYQAFDTEKERTVALKLLPPHLARDNDFRERFERESKTAAKLSDPHVIPIHNWGDVEGVLYIDMRLVDGRDLRKVLADGPLPPQRAVHILSQIAGALDAAHRSGLVHRDVKPDNILVDFDDFAYLVDFGIAHGATDSRLTRVGTALGTLAYMAPERFNDEPAGPSSDIYALTCVLYECIVGATPFPSTTEHGVISGHITKPPPVTGGPLDPVIARGLAKDPAHRFGTAKELMRAASAALSAPYQAPQPPRAAPGPGPTVVNPAAAGMASGPTVANPGFGPGPSGPHTPGPSGPHGAGGGFGMPPHSGPQSLSGPNAWGQQPPPPPPPPKKSNTGRNVAIAGAAAVVVIALVVAGVIFATSGGGGEGPGSSSTAAPPPSDAVDTVTCDYSNASTDADQAPKPADQQPETGTVNVAFTTQQGVLSMTLDREGAPCNVAAIQSLIEAQYYNNKYCLTSSTTFLLCGPSSGADTINPGWTSPNEFPDDLPSAGTNDEGEALVTYPRGTVGILSSDGAGGSSTFFMTSEDHDDLGTYSVIGELDEAGIETLQRIIDIGFTPFSEGSTAGPPNQNIVIQRATVVS